MKVAFFDFDGTITKKDSLFSFLKFSVGNLRFIINLFLLSPLLVLYKLKLISNYKAKEKILSFFFSGYKEDDFKKLANEYSLRMIDKLTRSEAMEQLQWHRDNSHKIVIVTASIDCWLRPWCEKNNFELIATKLEIKEHKITGRLLTKNCYGIEKKRRIKSSYCLDNFEYIYAYGDTEGDKEMLNLANKSFYKPFR